MRISDWSSDVCLPIFPAAVPAISALPTTVAGQPLPSLAPMLEKVTPAVVSVRTRQVVRVSPFGNDPFFRRMFPELTQQQLNQSLGSGVIIDAANGYVLTNHHVIEGARSEEHTSELQSLMRISYAVFCLKNK